MQDEIEKQKTSLSEIDAEISKIKSSADQAKQSLQEKTTEVQKSLEQKGEELTNQMDEILKTLQTQQNDLQTALNQKEEEINQIVAVIESNRSKAENVQENLQQTLEKANQDQQTISQVRSEIEGVKTEVDNQLQNATNTQKQCQGQVEISTKHAAEVKAKLESATQSLASIEEQKQNILSFYTDIENHKVKMVEIEKDTIAKLNQLKEKAEKDLVGFKERTRQIIDENVALQKRVDELLAGATSGGLFRVFHDRQDFLAGGRNFWKWAVGITSALVVAGVMVVAWALGDKPDVIFFVRLAVGVPLLFLMYFSARQYTRERQAEEEYAFKSAISLSLEPYRKLLEQMRKDKATETDFVKDLINEVFENPTKRLFKARKGVEDTEIQPIPLESVFDALENLPDQDFTSKGAVMDKIKSIFSSLGPKQIKLRK